jgi:hypothetical protein
MINHGANINAKDKSNKSGIVYIAESIKNNRFYYENSTPFEFITYIISKGGKKSDLDPTLLERIESGEFDDHTEIEPPSPRYSDNYDRSPRNSDFGHNDYNGGAKPKHTYKGRKYVIRTGSRGGKYILVKKLKIYI